MDEDDRHLAGLVRVNRVDARPFVVELGIEDAQVFVVPDRPLRIRLAIGVVRSAAMG